MKKITLVAFLSFFAMLVYGQTIGVQNNTADELYISVEYQDDSSDCIQDFTFYATLLPSEGIKAPVPPGYFVISVTATNLADPSEFGHIINSCEFSCTPVEDDVPYNFTWMGTCDGVVID